VVRRGKGEEIKVCSCMIALKTGEKKEEEEFREEASQTQELKEPKHRLPEPQRRRRVPIQP